MQKGTITKRAYYISLFSPQTQNHLRSCFYFGSDAAALIRTIFQAVKYIHSCGIVHRDLKPENLLFRSKAPDADIMIADFGLSRVMEENKFHLLTEICGTPGYMAPEIFKKGMLPYVTIVDRC